MADEEKLNCANEGGVFMVSSSITKNFVISGKEQVEMFAEAIEASAQNRPVRIPVSAREITEEAELIVNCKLKLNIFLIKKYYQ